MQYKKFESYLTWGFTSVLVATVAFSTYFMVDRA